MLLITPQYSTHNTLSICYHVHIRRLSYQSDFFLAWNFCIPLQRALGICITVRYWKSLVFLHWQLNIKSTECLRRKVLLSYKEAWRTKHNSSMDLLNWIQFHFNPIGTFRKKTCQCSLRMEKAMMSKGPAEENLNKYPISLSHLEIFLYLALSTSHPCRFVFSECFWVIHWFWVDLPIKG